MDTKPSCITNITSFNAIVETIEVQFCFLQNCRIFNKDELAQYKKERIEYERLIYEDPQIPVNILNEYITRLTIYLGTVSKRLNEWKGTSCPEGFKNDTLQRITFLQELRINLYGKCDRSFLYKYLKFGAINDRLSSVKAFLNKEFHNDVKVWSDVANALTRDFQNNRSAIEFVLTALENNPANEDLYKQILRLELDAAARSSRYIYLHKCNNRLIELLRKLLKEEHSVEYYMEVLDIILQYGFTTTLRDFYSGQIMASFPNSPIVWHRLAQNELLDDDLRISGQMGSTTCRHIGLNLKLRNCIQKYNEGFNIIAPSAKTNLWGLYIEFLVNLSLEDPDHKFDKILKFNTLKSALDEGYKYITEEQYSSWLERIHSEDAIMFIKFGLKTHPHSPKLWRALMHFESIDHNLNTLNDIFKQGRAALQEKSYLLWECFIIFHLLYSSHDDIQAIYKEGIKEHPNISDELKPQYLEWLAETEDIDAARQFYYDIADHPPYCKKLHFAMLKLEKYQSVYDFELIENIFLFTTKQFVSELDIWFEYVNFKVSCFILKFVGGSIDVYKLELKTSIEEICNAAKDSLSLNAYRDLVIHCVEIEQKLCS